jgi:hypothetical protein
VNDSAIQSILATTRANGCKVRVVGTAHSEDGVVLQKSETKAVVISLAKYTPTADWNDVLSGSTVKLSAGRTYLDLMAIARPAGFLMQSQTAGTMFTIGGVVANPSVHGSTMNAERLNSQMIALKAMLSNGTIVTITGNDVRAWRGSLGLLGIILAVEIQMRPDTGLKMNLFDDDLTNNWNKANFEAKINAVASTHDAVEWFYNVYTDRIQSMAMDFDGAPGFNFAATAAIYAAQKAANPDLAVTGAVVNPLNQFVTLIQGWLQSGPLLNIAIAALGWTTQADSWNANKNNQRDGYWVDNNNLVYFAQVQTYIPCATDCINDGTMFTAANAARTVLKNAANNLVDGWQPNLPMEWRIVNIQAGTLMLEHLNPGKYLSIELVVQQDPNNPTNAYGPFLKQLEDAWFAAFPNSKGHHGKAWGFGNIGALPRPYPFVTKTGTFYSTAVRNAFVAKMNQYDPIGLFRLGEGPRLLGLTAVPFDPRSVNGEPCDTFDNAQCVFGCCNKQLFSNNFNTCVDQRSNFLGPCQEGCQCNTWAKSCVLGVCW